MLFIPPTHGFVKWVNIASCIELNSQTPTVDTLSSLLPEHINVFFTVSPSPWRKSVNLTQKCEIAISKTSSASSRPPTQKTETTTTVAAIDTTVDSSSKKDRKLIKLVEQCKKSSDSFHFRNRYLNYVSVVRRLASAKQFSLIEDVVEHLKKYKEDITTERFAVRLIILYGNVGMLDHAQKVFDEMPDLNCERTVLSFNALLAACVASKKFDKFDELFRELPVKLSINPDIVTYNTVIKAFCEMGSMDMALSVLDQIENQGLEPDLITLNTLLDEFYAKDRFSDAEKIWAMIENKNLVPNIRSYNIKLRGLVFKGRVLEAVELFDELTNKGLKPDVLTFNALIKGFVKDKNLEEAKRWYCQLVECKCFPDKATFLTLIPFLCQNGDFGMAFEISKEYIRRRCVVDTAVMQLVVDGLAKESRMEEAMELVKLGKSNDHFCYKLELSLDS